MVTYIPIRSNASSTAWVCDRSKPGLQTWKQVAGPVNMAPKGPCKQRNAKLYKRLKHSASDHDRHMQRYCQDVAPIECLVRPSDEGHRKLENTRRQHRRQNQSHVSLCRIALLVLYVDQPQLQQKQTKATSTTQSRTEADVLETWTWWAGRPR